MYVSKYIGEIGDHALFHNITNYGNFNFSLTLSSFKLGNILAKYEFHYHYSE